MTQEEIERIAGHLQMPSEAFLMKYGEERHGRFYIKTGANHYCIFYDEEKSCLIHPVKPRRCELWPFYPAIVRDKANWELAREACPGISSECSFEEFVRQSEAAKRD